MQVLRSVTGSDMVQITSIPSASSAMAVIVLLCSLPILLNKYLTLILKKMASRKKQGKLVCDNIFVWNVLQCRYRGHDACVHAYIVYYLNSFILVRVTWKSSVSSKRSLKSIQPNMFDVYSLSVLCEPDHSNQCERHPVAADSAARRREKL